MEPQIIIPSYITRAFIQNHLEWIFIYSFDVAGKSFFGQAYECHGEPNTYPIPVRWKGCKTSGYFSDASFIDIRNCIDVAIMIVPIDKPRIVLPKIGEGASRMKEFAPRSHTYLVKELDKIKYTNIKINYT